jgi:hypothetical protein
MSRFLAEVTITLRDGKTIVERYNQAEMAQFTCRNMLALLREGAPLVAFDGESLEIPADRVASVDVSVSDGAVLAG